MTMIDPHTCQARTESLNCTCCETVIIGCNLQAGHDGEYHRNQIETEYSTYIFKWRVHSTIPTYEVTYDHQWRKYLDEDTSCDTP